MSSENCRVFGEAWKNVHGIKKPFWRGIGLLFLISTVGGAFFKSAMAIAKLFYPAEVAMTSSKHGFMFFIQHGDTIPLGFILFLLCYFLCKGLFEMCVISPMRMGLWLIPLRHNVGKTAQASFVFTFFTWHYIWRFAVLEAMLMFFLGAPVAVGIGIIFFAKIFVLHQMLQLLLYAIGAAVCCIALYLVVLFFFSNLLIIDKNMAPWEAIKTSSRVVSGRWFCVFGALLWMMCAAIIGLLLLVVGLVWAVPYTQNIYVLMYRDLFGIAHKDPVGLHEI